MKPTPKCRVCESGATYICGEQYGWTLWKCGDCGFFFAEPGEQAQQPNYNANYFKAFIDRDSADDWHDFYASTLEELKTVSPGVRILDAGSGASMFTPTASTTGWKATAVDGSEDAIEYLATRFGIEGYVADLNQPDAIPNALGTLAEFDAVNSWHVIEHLTRPGDYLSGIRNVLVRGGILHLGLPAYPWPRVRGHEILRKLRLVNHHFNLGMPDHVSFFEPKTIITLLKRRGFRVKNIEKTAYSSILDVFEDTSSRGLVRRVGKTVVRILSPLSSRIRIYHHLRIIACKT